MPENQAHGSTFENLIRTIGFSLPNQQNNTNIHDISIGNENISVKSTGCDNVDCGDIYRFSNYNHKEKCHNIVIIQYKQSDNKKFIKNIIEISYTQELRDYLFGTITNDEITEYINLIKSIPKGKNTDKYYLHKKSNLEKDNNMKIKISPKVDSHEQRRVQCSFNIDDIPKEFITYNSSTNTGSPNIFRGKQLPEYISSKSRSRGGITVNRLRDICKKNNIRGYSRYNKDVLINLLLKNSIKFSD